MPYFFKLPPINELTQKQQNAIHWPEGITLKGGPGTGKSVVTLYRHIRNCDGPNPGYLITYHKALCKYLKIAAKYQKNNKDNIPHHNNIITTTAFIHNYSSRDINSEIIFDETQDLDKSHYIHFKESNVSYAIDVEQSTNIHKDFLLQLEKELKSWYYKNKEIILDENFRNTNQIIDLVRCIFPHKVIPHEIKYNGPLPELVYTSEINQIEAITSIIRIFYGQRHNIGILYPTGTEVEYYYKEISNEIPELDISKYHAGINDLNQIENIHITTFKSCKGLEFDTVIIPDFNKSIYKNERLLNENEIYVALTRTKVNLYLIDNRSIKDKINPLPFLKNAIHLNIIKENNDYI
jgi:superfamily I DNA/RNA helicase